MKKPLILLMIFLIFSCSRKQDEYSNLKTIKVVKPFEDLHETNLSMLTDNVVYLPLELTDKSLVGQSPKIAVTEDYIIVRNYKYTPPLLILFDRQTGKFIRNIGTMGRGPNEYSSVPENFFNSEENLIYALGSNHNLMVYNLKGDLINDFKIPDIFEVKGMPFSSGGFDAYLDSNTYASFVTNWTGKEKKKIVLFSKDSVIKIFPNYRSWNRIQSNTIHVFTLQNLFYHFENRLFFKEAFNDTLFEVKKDILLPRYAFSLENYSIPYELQGEYLASGKLNKSITVDGFTENLNFVFFNIRNDGKTYLSYINKKNNVLRVCSGNELTNSALIDDINGFLPITQFNFNDHNELISYYESFKIKYWIKLNPEKAQSLSKKFPWINNLDESGNPVIIIAKCKE